MISQIQQEEADFDWFGIDEDALVGHFTTAGFKLLPKSVAASAEDLSRVTKYFKQLPSIGGYEIDNNLEREAGWFEDSKARVRYLSGFTRVASAGLYSYDIDTYVKPGLAYFRVAIPIVPLRLDLLPSDIREIVGRTLLRGVRFGANSRLDYESTLDA